MSEPVSKGVPISSPAIFSDNLSTLIPSALEYNPINLFKSLLLNPVCSSISFLLRPPILEITYSSKFLGVKSVSISIF
jgi:hypothetical protein